MRKFGIHGVLIAVLSAVCADAGTLAIVNADSSAPATAAQAALLATGRFDAVDLIDAYGSSPVLGTLSGYDAVLAYSNRQLWDPTGLGNVLAQYYNLGGRGTRQNRPRQRAGTVLQSGRETSDVGDIRLQWRATRDWRRHGQRKLRSTDLWKHGRRKWEPGGNGSVGPDFCQHRPCQRQLRSQRELCPSRAGCGRNVIGHRWQRGGHDCAQRERSDRCQHLSGRGE